MSIPSNSIQLNSEYNAHEIFHPDKFPSHRYHVLRDGQIWSSWKDGFLKKHLDTDGDRWIVRITMNGVNRTYRVSKLVAYCWCDNRRMLHIVHHINGNPLDDRAINLMYVTEDEHHELHRLMKSEKKEYRKRVKEIRQLNKWDHPAYFIIEHDELTANDSIEYGYAVTRKGWQAYIKDHNIDDISPDDIVIEFARPKAKEGE